MKMESLLTETAVSQGIWAIVAIFLLLYVVKSNEKRDEKQEEREKNYQKLLSELTEKFSVLNNIQSDISDIKDFLQGSSNNKSSPS